MTYFSDREVNAATGETDGIVPLLKRSLRAGSKTVDMLKPFCWPGVGARNPLLTLARTKA